MLLACLLRSEMPDRDLLRYTNRGDADMSGTYQSVTYDQASAALSISLFYTLPELMPFPDGYDDPYHNSFEGILQASLEDTKSNTWVTEDTVQYSNRYSFELIPLDLMASVTDGNYRLSWNIESYNYQYFQDAGDFRVIIETSATEGKVIGGTDTIDFIFATTHHDYVRSLSGDDVIDGNEGDDVIMGGNGADVIRGGEGNDVLFGDHGSDILDGGSGGDRMHGGTQDDTYYVDHESDVIIESSDGANGGTDTVISSVSRSLGSYEEHLTLSGVAAIDGTGNSLANKLTGNAANNTLAGSAGDDTLYGDEGNDLLGGGADKDTLDGGAGTDTADYSDKTSAVLVTLNGATAASVSVSDAVEDSLKNIENVTGGSAADKLTGDSLANTLIGNAGNDTLDGGLGNDTMAGNAGNDTYHVRDGGDVITEAANEGIDTVYSYFASYTLATNVEVSHVMSAGTASLTGNAHDNFLYAGKGNNALSGGTGTDSVSYYYGHNGIGVSVSLINTAAQATGGSGSDTLTSIENLYGTNYADKLTGNTGINYLRGYSGNDSLDGGTGSDTMAGNAGNDAYYVRDSGDVVTEAANEGADTVYSYLTSYSLGANVENGRVMSTGAANLAGNGLNNVIYAGKGNNALAGGSGTDTLSYAYGANGTTGVKVSLATTAAQATGGSGTDTISGFERLTGSANNDSLTGNSGANLILGGNGNDSVIGSSGNDTLYGGAGNDLLRGGSGNDILYGGAGKDIFRFDTALGTSTMPNIDTIKDFSVIDDTIRLENAIFTKFGTATTGTINAAYFKANTTGLAADSNDYIIYETDTGELFYDSNGSAAGGSVQIALLGTNIALTNADFVLV